MTCAVKNMYGIVPGSVKSEYHYRYSNPMDFARMIVDLNLARPAQLHIVDAVVGMEGNGPTAGTPRPIGCLLASCNPYRLDMICAGIIACRPACIPTLPPRRSAPSPPRKSEKSLSVTPGSPILFQISKTSAMPKTFSIRMATRPFGARRSTACSAPR